MYRDTFDSGERVINRRGSEIARAAWLYHLEELTQGEIALRLGVSRSTVVRLLQRAKETGMVRVTLDVPHEIFEMERELERLYGLRRVRIVPQATDEPEQKRWLGHGASELLSELVEPGTTTAVSWGTTMQALATSFVGERAVAGGEIVPLVGGFHRASSGTNAHWVAEQLGRYFGAESQALYAPVYVEDLSTAEALMRNPGIRDTLELVRKASLAIYSVGNLDPEATMIRLGYLSPDERAFLQERGAVADITCRWIDIEGDPVELPSTINPIGVSLEDLKNIPERLTISGGDRKREALLGTLRGGYTTTLVTDEGTASYLLERVLDSSEAPQRGNQARATGARRAGTH
jgi:DNA-binding transcriptional regulator LsrR (DeoR family)